MPKQTKTQSWDPNWKDDFADMIETPAAAVKRIRPGQRVFVGTGCGQPQSLVTSLSARAGELTDTEIIHLLTSGDAPYADEKLSEYFRVNSFFIAKNVRGIIQDGLGDYTPIFLSEIPRLFTSGQTPLDAALIQVSPPDERGMCSLGISVDIVKSAAENASLVIAEVNENMPRTLGDSFMHVHDFDVLVPTTEPMIELASPEPTDVTHQIGEYVAALVEDGSTIEFSGCYSRLYR